jgi:hypothetical protein
MLALLVVVALAAEFGLASLSRHPAALASGSRTPPPARATVSQALRACPGPGSTGATASGLALAVAGSGTGQATVTRLSPAGATAAPAPLRVLTQPGLLSLVSVATAPALPRDLAQASAAGAAGAAVPTGPARGGVMISASGAMARGLEAEQTSSGGLGTSQCLGPGTDFWFVGPGQKSAADIELYLMNTDGVAADASVSVVTDSGPVLGSADAGIGVPPYSMVVQSLSGLVRGSTALALNVTTSVGRVVPAVLETSGAGQPGAWLPAAQPPATTQLLPGLPAAPGDRDLYVAVPGSANAQIKVTAVTARGSYQPTGGTGIDLPGGSAITVALPSLGGIPAAVEVSSSVPVTASMGLPGGAAGAPGAFTAAAAPLQEQGVIAGNPAGGGTCSLVLSAPGAAAQVQVTELTSAGQVTGSSGSQTVQLAAGHSQVITLAPPRPGGRPLPFAVVITPLAGSGPVYAGRAITQFGTVRSILPVASSLSWVPLPAVRSSVSTAALP